MKTIATIMIKEFTFYLEEDINCNLSIRREGQSIGFYLDRIDYVIERKYWSDVRDHSEAYQLAANKFQELKDFI